MIKPTDQLNSCSSNVDETDFILCKTADITAKTRHHKLTLNLLRASVLFMRVSCLKKTAQPGWK